MKKDLISLFKEATGIQKVKLAKEIKALKPLDKIKLMKSRTRKQKDKSALNLEDIGEYVKGAKKDRYNNIKSNIRASVIKRTTPKKLTVHDLRQAGLKDNEIMTALLVRKGFATSARKNKKYINWDRALALYEKLIDKSLKIKGVHSFNSFYFSDDEELNNEREDYFTTIEAIKKRIGVDKIDDEMMFALCSGKYYENYSIVRNMEFAYNDYQQAITKEANETKQTSTKTKVAVEKESILETYERKDLKYGIKPNYRAKTIIYHRYFENIKFPTEEEAQAYIDNLTSDEINEMIKGSKIVDKIVTATDGHAYYTYYGKRKRRSSIVPGKNAEVLMTSGEYEKPDGWQKAIKIIRETIFSKIDIVNNFRDKEPQARIGTDYRQGRDIDGEELKKTIGFKSIQYGNWLNNKDRIARLNQTYDSFKDMKQITGIEDFSLGGKLSMAFGSRGKKGAVAHFESFSNIINLTKKNGAGSLGHEWWHSFDYYIGEGKPYTEKDDNPTANEKVKREIKKLVFAITNTEYYKHSHKADTITGKNYFGTKVELTARAYERYLIKKLSDKSISNDFLATINQLSGVYPTDKDLETLSPIFDEIFKQYKKEYKQGSKNE